MRTCDNVWYRAGVLMLLLAISLAAFAQQNESSRTLGQLLNPDGSLRLQKRMQGSFRADGYRMVLGPHGEPRFRAASSRPESATGITTDTADVHWDNRFAVSSGFDGSINAIFVDSGIIYIGGYFTTVGSTPAMNIVKWDGTSWSPLGAGIVNGYVKVISKFHNDIYVGGRFFSPGGAPGNCIAKWDGNAWSPLGVPPNDGVDGEVRALLPVGDSLYLGGDLYWGYGDTTTVYGVGIWDGSTMKPAPGLNLSAIGVRSLASDGKNLYVGGDDFLIGGHPRYGVIRWDGSTWELLGPQGHFGIFGSVYGMLWLNGNLYVGGAFDSAGGVSVNNIARWDGSAWAPLGPGFNGAVFALSNVNGKLYAGGDFSASGVDTMNALAWYDTTRATWNLVAAGVAPPGSSVQALAWTGAALLMGGRFAIRHVNYSNGFDYSYYAASWTGGSITPIGISSKHDGISGFDGTIGYGDFDWRQVNAIAISGDSVYVGGNFTTVGSVQANNIACWNNLTGSWSTLGEGFDQSVVALVINGSDLYAGGLFAKSGGVPANRVARWDGNSWHPLGTPPNDGISGLVLSLLEYSGNLYAGGDFRSAGGSSANNIARWNGSTWSPLGNGVGGDVTSMDVFHDELYVGGLFSEAYGASANYIARWDGVSWKTVGNPPDDGVDSWVYALHTAGDYLYAGGNFTKAGTTSANYIARWDGSSWSAIGPGFNGAVRSIISSGGSVYAGGDFTASGVRTVNGLARWDTTSPTWAALGSGTNKGVFTTGKGVFALALLNNDLFAGGQFTVAGGKASSLFGHWNSTLVTTHVKPSQARPLSIALEQNYPNPFNPSTAISFQLSAVSEVKLVVYDVLGREVATLVNERKEPGRYEIRFDGSHLASGLYFFRLVAGKHTETRKMVLMK